MIGTTFARAKSVPNVFPNTILTIGESVSFGTTFANAKSVPKKFFLLAHHLLCEFDINPCGIKTYDENGG